MANSAQTTSTSSRSVNGNGKHAAAAVYAAVHIDGRALNRLLRRSAPSQKAVITHDLRTGRLEVGPLTWAQSLALTGASSGYAYTASQLTDAERAAVDLGQSLSVWHLKPDAFTTALTRTMNEVMRGTFRDEAVDVGTLVDRLVERYPDRVMAALDRHTSPELPLAA
jgi:hypothetical protein